MGSEFKKVAILGRHADPRVAEPMTLLAEHLTKHGVEVLAGNELELDVPVTRLEESNLSDAADLMIAIGGDGTMLYAGSLARDKGIPLLGINRGRLGFLADVTPDEMINSVDLVLADVHRGYDYGDGIQRRRIAASRYGPHGRLRDHHCGPVRQRSLG